MTVTNKMKEQFRILQGGLSSDVKKADVGEGTGNFVKNGGDNMAWADMFAPDPSIPESVQKASIEAILNGSSAHYTMPIGLLELREEIAKHVSKKTGLTIHPSRNVIITPGSDAGFIFSLLPFLKKGDEVLIPDPCYPSNYLNCKLKNGKDIKNLE